MGLQAHETQKRKKQMRDSSIREWLAMGGGVSLLLWALCVTLGTGIGYDHPIHGLFDGGISSLWRLTKAGFLSAMGVAVIKAAIELLEQRTEGKL